ncbi:MAG: HEPN domain-containing protein [Thermus sp.]|uniref:HEPN domain-containing protein n=2 Tax=Thermus sp. TaxID=275 RepID=UPI003D0E9C04
MNRAKDWLLQAEKDLEMAEIARNAGRHEWACFAAQQAAEKAAKALHLHLGQEAWGHLVARLLKELPLEVPQELVEKARYLDGLYIPTRYPDAFPEGPSAEHYGPLQSEEAVSYAREVLGFVRAKMA